MAEELIASAVTFLQDPKVADAPLAKRIAFLESKGLSSDQVQIALQRAQQEYQSSSTNVREQQSQPQTLTRPPISYSPSLPPSNYVTYQQQAAPPLPQRDWRDWFIMAVVSGGFSWAAYFLAKRYVLPLIAPPTPTQLDTDKETVAAQFDQVQEMLSILQKDTEQVKEQNAEQNKKVETALEQVDAAVKDMQEKTARRETDIRRIGLELDQIREMIPKAIDAVKAAQGEALNDLGGELRSLKTLLQNRLKATSAPFNAANSATNGASTSSTASTTPNATTQKSAASASTAPSAPTSAGNAQTLTTASNPKTTTGDPLARFSSRAGNGIPEWQRSATVSPTLTEGSAGTTGAVVNESQGEQAET